MALMFIFVVYQILLLLSLPFVAFYMLLRKFKGKPVFGNVLQRIGFVPSVKGQKVVWFHAVSAGEVLAISHLIKQTKQQHPDYLCYLTVGTLAGKKMANKNVEADFISFMPYDFLPCVWIAMMRVRPLAIVLVEAELWPNFLMMGHWFGSKIYLLNARLKDKSFGKFKRLKSFFSPLLQLFDGIYTQTQLDKRRFEMLGILPERLVVLGDIKAFNYMERRNETIGYEKTDEEKSRVLLAGSIHPGELKIYLKLYKKLKQTHPALKLILAPRHFHWKAELLDELGKLPFKFFVWDDVNHLHKNFDELWQEYDILAVCKLGELFKLYSAADIFYLGGTFVPVGGHNLLEPAVWAKPSIVGPDYHTCIRVVDELEKVGGLFKVRNEQALFDKTSLLIENAPLRHQMGNRALDWVKNEALSVSQQLSSFLTKF